MLKRFNVTWSWQLVSSCANCQIAQRSQVGQEREYAQLPIPRYIEPFQHWGILDLIGSLPPSRTGNRWILTTIDYATGWPIAKALPEATSEAIAEFIFSEMYMHLVLRKRYLSMVVVTSGET